jgi:hypothetical protein
MFAIKQYGNPAQEQDRPDNFRDEDRCFHKDIQLRTHTIRNPTSKYYVAVSSYTASQYTYGTSPRCD